MPPTLQERTVGILLPVVLIVVSFYRKWTCLRSLSTVSEQYTLT